MTATTTTASDFQIAEYGVTVGRATTVHAVYAGSTYPICGSVHRGGAYFTKTYQPVTCAKCQQHITK